MFIVLMECKHLLSIYAVHTMVGAERFRGRKHSPPVVGRASSLMEETDC